jgi:ribosomal-protein-alanine N-acetyltransferase
MRAEPGGVTAADAPALAAIMRRSFETSWSEDAFRTELERPMTRARAARSDVPVGYVLGWRVLDEVQILSFAVDPAWRGRGVAADLLGDYQDYLREEEVRRVMLEVRESNAAARALYARRGFRVEGERAGYYPEGETALLLGAELRAAR